MEFEFEQQKSPGARIKVIGVGGAGCNAINSLAAMGLKNVDFYAINTDLQSLEHTNCPNKLQIGAAITGGKGCGSDPLAGKKAAEDALEELEPILQATDMVFITAGMGGGTGTGASPVLAEIAKALGILTVAFVTKPFAFEGPQRMKRAQSGIEQLRRSVDSLIVISNDKLLQVAGKNTSLTDSFKMVNSLLAQGVTSIADLISEPGLINMDFANVRTIMSQKGGAVIGSGVGKGESRATEAIKKACSSPLLEKIVIDGARGILISIAGGPDLTLHEVNEAVSMVYEAADPDANIIFGAMVRPELSEEVRVTIIATGFEDETPRPYEREKEMPEPLASPSSPVSLKSKLEAMMSARGREKSTADTKKGNGDHGPNPLLNQAKEAASKDDKPAKKEKHSPAAPTLPPLKDEESVAFNEPVFSEADKSMFGFEPENDDEDELEEVKVDSRKKQSDEDLDTPPFLRRRKSLFD
ncbi:MAG: cell division protein FtsZ [bacterium]